MSFWLVKLIILFMFFQWPTRGETDYFWLKIILIDIFHVSYFYSIYSLIFPKTFGQQKYVLFAAFAIAASCLHGLGLVWIWSGFSTDGVLAFQNHVAGFISVNLIFFSIAFTWRFMVYLVNVRQKKIVKDKQQKSSELLFLQEHINPNFLKETLQFTKRLSETNPEKSKKALTYLKTLIQTTQKLKGNKAVDLYDEFEFLKSYIHLKELKYTLNVEVWFPILERKQLKVYPLLILPIINNAFSYSDLSAKGEISIKVSVRKTWITVNVRSKVGSNDTAAHEKRLHHLNLKLEKIYEENYEFNYELIGDVFVSKLKIPSKIA